MPVTSTSKKSYMEMNRSGGAAVQRVKIMSYLRCNMGSSLRDIYEGLDKEIDYSAISARSNELEACGAIFKDGIKTNNTNRPAARLWITEGK